MCKTTRILATQDSSVHCMFLGYSLKVLTAKAFEYNIMASSFQLAKTHADISLISAHNCSICKVLVQTCPPSVSGLDIDDQNVL